MTFWSRTGSCPARASRCAPSAATASSRRPRISTPGSRSRRPSRTLSANTSGATSVRAMRHGRCLPGRRPAAVGPGRLRHRHLPRPVLGRLVLPGEHPRPRQLPRFLRRPRPRRLGDAGARCCCWPSSACATPGCWRWPIRRRCSPCRPRFITWRWRGCAHDAVLLGIVIAARRRGLSADLVLHHRRVQRDLRRRDRRHGDRADAAREPPAAMRSCSAGSACSACAPTRR